MKNSTIAWWLACFAALTWGMAFGMDLVRDNPDVVSAPGYIIAASIAGGLILWGVYELGKRSK